MANVIGGGSPSAMSVGFGEYRLEARGVQGMLLAVVMLMLVGVAYGSFTAFTALRGDLKTMQDELQVMTYVLAQPEDKRPKLLMPPELVRRLDKR